MKVRVDVTLKHGVLDPQGKAVAHALVGLGFLGVRDVRVGKTIELDIDAASDAAAKENATRMATALLANQVIEDFSVTVLAA
ncbi:MAG: phosphoribosylformylglycinamidine synthase subunit PurS [Alphaproteobacteria bacterium]|nr:phosphoribosylformylglycinamidine synthase subunit PurS [Alphaproteobacteria bacterium]NDC55879.1 phosphoribosylformylglycinamidine synthase subunit PurS [Alphaproteobacteria bacterium]NDG04044.1 phosphoribosylformylglycinamidine synthase subunit PurS [Alphaproteobacteria bacterium]